MGAFFVNHFLQLKTKRMKRSAVDPEWLDLGQARNVMNFSVRKKRRNESRMIGFYLSRSQVLEMVSETTLFGEVKQKIKKQNDAVLFSCGI